MILTFLAGLTMLGGTYGQRPDLPMFPVRGANYWKWRDLAWTVEDKTVTEARKRVDMLADKGASSLSQVEKMALDAKRQFERAPKPDARPLIIWMYAAFRAGRLDSHSWQRTKATLARNYVEIVQPIASYEYARIRFLALSDMSSDKYIPVAKRLLNRDYKDYWVRFYFTRLMNSLNKIADAKRMCLALIRDWPSKPNVYALAGDTYYLASFNIVSKPDLLEAKKYYEIFIKKAPSSDNYIDMAKWRLNNIEKKLSGA